MSSISGVRADLDAVGLAIRNLVENALIHGAGGKVIRLVGKRTLDGAMLAVIDEGPGVKGVEPSSLVKRFVRGSAAGSGAGLGLAIVDALARRMGVTLVLQSPAQGQPAGFEARLVWAAAGQTRESRRERRSATGRAAGEASTAEAAQRLPGR